MTLLARTMVSMLGLIASAAALFPTCSGPLPVHLMSSGTKHLGLKERRGADVA